MWNGCSMSRLSATAIAVTLGVVAASCGGGGKATVANNSHPNNSGQDAGPSTDPRAPPIRRRLLLV